ncbi:MAG TPA: hypothetical protein VF749_00990, partial [Candidatus Acidoferrum sp.]
MSALQGVYLKKAGSRAAVTDSALIGLNPAPMATKVSGMTAEMPARMALAPRSWTASIARIRPSALKVVSLDPFGALGPGQDSALGIEEQDAIVLDALHQYLELMLMFGFPGVLGNLIRKV